MVSRIEARLFEDPLGNVMSLKFLSLLGRVSKCGLLEDGRAWATWFHYSPGQFAFDAQMYGDRTRIVYWNSNDSHLANASLRELPLGAVIKVSTEPCLSVAREHWPQLNEFVWFSTDRQLSPAHPVERFDSVHEDLVTLSAENTYSREALVEQEARGCRWYLASVDGVPQALCYVQPNYGAVWEVSGVYTRPEFRGRGLAKAVAAAAVNDLVARGLTPRYFVHDQNCASLAVARALGLVERGRTRHFGPS